MYETPDMEVIEIEAEDVVTTSDVADNDVDTIGL